MTLEREWQSWYKGGKFEWQNNQFFSSSENEPSLLYIHLGATNKQSTMKEKVHFFGKRNFDTFMWTKCARVKLHRPYFVVKSIQGSFLSTTTSYSHWTPVKTSVQELTGTLVCPDKNFSSAHKQPSAFTWRHPENLIYHQKAIMGVHHRLAHIGTQSRVW